MYFFGKDLHRNNTGLTNGKTCIVYYKQLLYLVAIILLKLAIHINFPLRNGQG